MAQADNPKLRVSGYPKDGTRRWVTEEVASLEGPFQVVGTPVDFERLVGGVWVSTDAEGEGDPGAEGAARSLKVPRGT